jgi:PAS domain S-box-containing protein
MVTVAPDENRRSALASEHHYRLFIEQVRDYALFMRDPHGVVASWNVGAQRIKGYRAEEIIGQHFSRFYPQGDIDARKPQYELEVAARVGRFEDEGWRLRKDGTRFWANVVITAIRDDAGALIGFAKVTRDLSDRKKAEEQRLQLAKEIATREASERALELVRRLHAVAGSLAAAVSPEDVADVVVNEAARALDASAAILVEPRGGELAILRGDAAHLDESLASRAFESKKALWLENGERGRVAAIPLVVGDRAIGAVAFHFSSPHEFDAAERALLETMASQAAQALERANGHAREVHAHASLMTTLRSIGDAVIATDAKGAVTLMNPVAERLTGWPEADARGLPLATIFRIINEHSRKPVESPVDKVLALGVVVGLANHTVLIARDGREVPIDDSGAPIRSGDQVQGVVLVFRDVTEKKRSEGRHELLSDATALLAESLDDGVTLGRVADLAVARFADWCAIDLVREGEPVPRRVASAGAEILDAPPAGSDSSRITVPLASTGGRTLGTLTLAYAESGKSYTKEDLELAEELGKRCATAIENAELYASVQRAREAADAANRAKDEFLAVVSHELRTPLNAILGWAKMLGTSHVDETRRERAIDTIERNAVAMAQLIEDILDMSRVISGKMRLDVQRVELHRVIEAAIESIRPAADSKGIRVTWSPDNDLPPLMGDPTRLQQVVWNLLSNAVKFTPRDGQVDVQLQETGSAIELVVSDTGKGIDPSFLPHVFDPFRQQDASYTRARGGLGLGLAITRQLVELHGGRITAESDGEGRGARFRVWLPIAAVAITSAPESAPAFDPRRARELDRPAQLKGLSVLVVDDEPDARHLVAVILEACECRVTTAGSVEEAIATISREVPDVLISDIAMPGKDGYELIRHLRALAPSEGGDIPAAALTAYTRVEDRRRILNAGFSMHVPKPVEPAELVAVLTSLTRFMPRRH